MRLYYYNNWLNYYNMLALLSSQIDLEKLGMKFSGFISNNDSSVSDSSNNEIKPSLLKQPNFKLPITYIDPSKIHNLSSVVSSDLELIGSSDSLGMYDHLFQPKHEFAQQMLDSWKMKFTTDVNFLTDSQKMLGNMELYKTYMSANKYSVDCSQIMEIWKDIKEDAAFLEKYNYMEWEMLKSMNSSAPFLQCLSVLNIVSPLLSLIIPIIFLIFPFVILKIQGVPITFETYMELLKTIAKNHFIGKTLFSLQSFTWDKMGYVLLTGFLYFVQIYQNVCACFRFYRNLKKITEHICDLRQYIQYSISSMENFVEVNRDCPAYSEFCCDVSRHSSVLQEMALMLESIRPFGLTIGKFSEIGHMLKCFYVLHTNVGCADALLYSMGFEGYINNILGVCSHIDSGTISLATFDASGSSEITEQVYPAHVSDSTVKNSCRFDKNMIITGPNASGKTTLLKTTTINIIFTQQFGCGFYKSCSLNPYTHIHSYLNIPDTSGRDSLFQAESRRCKEIIDIIGENLEASGARHYCIFDELYSGTNPVEAAKAAKSFLAYLTKFEHVDFILTTHYTSICKKLENKESGRIRNYKMDVETMENGQYKYTYLLKRGISKIQGAKQILKDMDYPREIVENFDE
jgi:hypothetical protein